MLRLRAAGVAKRGPVGNGVGWPAGARARACVDWRTGDAARQTGAGDLRWPAGVGVRPWVLTCRRDG